jgi:hypothetical protein
MGYKEDIAAANRQGRTRKERWDLRAAVREQYGKGEEQRKRGGLAGLYDSNKDVIVPVAAGVAGLASGGLLAPALVGGLARGFDREGEGGIGFDVGQGIRGGLEGAAYGGAAQLARGALCALLRSPRQPAHPPRSSSWWRVTRSPLA